MGCLTGQHQSQPQSPFPNHRPRHCTLLLWVLHVTITPAAACDHQNCMQSYSITSTLRPASICPHHSLAPSRRCLAKPRTVSRPPPLDLILRLRCRFPCFECHGAFDNHVVVSKPSAARLATDSASSTDTVRVHDAQPLLLPAPAQSVTRQLPTLVDRLEPVIQSRSSLCPLI